MHIQNQLMFEADIVCVFDEQLLFLNKIMGSSTECKSRQCEQPFQLAYRHVDKSLILLPIGKSQDL